MAAQRGPADREPPHGGVATQRRVLLEPMIWGAAAISVATAIRVEIALSQAKGESIDTFTVGRLYDRLSGLLGALDASLDQVDDLLAADDDRAG